MLARPGHSPEVIESLPAVPVAAAAGAPKRPAVVVVKSATGSPPVATKPAVPALPPVRPRAQTKRVELGTHLWTQIAAGSAPRRSPWQRRLFQLHRPRFWAMAHR